jgi:hypothetical protein
MMVQCIPKVSPRSHAEIERIAGCVLLRFQPERLRRPGVTDILSLFHQLRNYVPGAEYGVSGDLGYGVEGMVRPDGSVDVSPETYEGVAEGLPRPRWTMAHEIGHAVLHLSQIREALVDFGKVRMVRQESCRPFENPEVQAHQFAAGLLTPAKMVVAVLAVRRRCPFFVIAGFRRRPAREF